jgi:hypothetical protein
LVWARQGYWPPIIDASSLTAFEGSRAMLGVSHE